MTDQNASHPAGDPAEVPDTPPPASGLKRGGCVLVLVAVLGLLIWLARPEGLKHESKLSNDMSGVCKDPGTAFTSAPAYAGPGPHPAAAILYSEGGWDWWEPHRDSPAATGKLSWSYPEDDSQLQLIACIKPEASSLSPVATCTYNGSNGQVAIPMDDTDYTLSLREIRTHKEVAMLTFTGADHNCPGTIATHSGDQSHLQSQPTADQLTQLLTPYLN